jgi:hypothetical protein
MYADSTTLTSGADRLHQRNLGFPKRIQKALIADGSLFGGFLKRSYLNGYMSAIRLQGMAGLTKSSHLFDTAQMQAKERQTVMECTQYILRLACIVEKYRPFALELSDVVVEHNILSDMVDQKHHTFDSIGLMDEQCIKFMDLAVSVWDNMPSELTRIFGSLNFPKFPNYLEYAHEWADVGSPHIVNDTEAFEMAGKSWHKAWEFNNKQQQSFQQQLFLHECRRCARCRMCLKIKTCLTRSKRVRTTMNSFWPLMNMLAHPYSHELFLNLPEPRWTNVNLGGPCGAFVDVSLILQPWCGIFETGRACPLQCREK